MNKEVLIKFTSQEQAQAFMSWLCNSGEQEYFDMEEYEDNIASNLDYDFENQIINAN